MPDREKVIYDIERCICHVPDACRDCSHYGHDAPIGCMEELLADALVLLKEQENYVSIPFTWLVKFCTHIDFHEPMSDEERTERWKEKLSQQFGVMWDEL